MSANPDELFGEVLHSYTRAQAIEDGVLVDGTIGDFADVTRQHYKFPVVMTAAVFSIIKEAVEHPTWCNDYKGVWHDILWMSRFAVSDRLNGSEQLFRVIIRGAGRKRYHTFKIVCGPGDDATPVLTVMLPEED